MFVTVNAGRAESYGFEGAGPGARPAGSICSAPMRYNHSRFASGARDGNRFRLSPDHSAALAVQSAVVPAGPGTIDFTPSVTWQSKVFFDDDNDIPALQANNLVPDPVQDECTEELCLLADARLGTGDRERPLDGSRASSPTLQPEVYQGRGQYRRCLGMPTFIAGEPRAPWHCREPADRGKR